MNAGFKRGVLAVLALLTLQAWAEVVPGLYRVEVPVAQQSAQALQRAAAEGLEQVLVRISGQRDLSGNAEIRQALSQADRYLEQYQYLRREPEPEGGPPTEPELLAEVAFEQQEVEQLLRRAGLPIWSPNRPTVLVWLVMDDARGRALVNSETHPQLVKALRAEARRRGLALKFPLLDLEDTAALSVEELWAMRDEAVARASERYDPGAVLMGRVSRVSSGQLLGGWRFLFAGDSYSIDAQAQDAAAFVAPAVDRAADALAAEYAIWPVKIAEEGLLLRLTGVTDFHDYAQAMDYLQRTPAIQEVDVLRVEGDELLLRLVAEGQLEQLRRVLELGNKLQPEETATGEAALSYRWAGQRG